MAIEIKSSLLNDDDFKFTKKSLIEASEIDGEDKFRVKTIEYINDSSSEENDVFFYNMLEFVRFLNPNEGGDHIAFTTPEHLIYLNCPGSHIGKNVRQWDFTYDHECLHQLWNTFGVADKIKKQYGSYNHELLNLASDCVINDYLSYYRKKDMPKGLVTPDWIKEKFNVDYDRKNDTQFSLYIKMKASLDKMTKEQKEKLENDPIMKDAKEEFGDRKIKPGQIKKDQSGQDGESGMPPQKHSDEYRKGWKDGIKDVLDKKVDPEKYIPKKANDDYTKGYNDALDNIKKGIKDGLTMSNSSSNNSSSDLPEIPWEKPNDSSSKNNNSDNKDNNKSDNKSDSNNSDNSSGDKENDSSKSVSDIDNMSSDEAASDAQKSADKAKEAADKAKSGVKTKEEKEAADRAQKYADEAQKNANKAKEATKKNDTDGARKAAKDARDNSKQAESINNKINGEKEGNNTQYGDPKTSEHSWGRGTANDNTELSEDLEGIKKKAEKYIEDARNKISGMFGDFISKCKVSSELKESGLKIKAQNGVSGWNQQMNQAINAFVKKKVFQKKRTMEQTYKRMNRRQGEVKMGDVILKGKRIKKDGLTINVAFYIDRSASMYSCIDDVFKAAYVICESLKKQFSKEKVVDEITFKMHAFDNNMHVLPFGKKMTANGGNMDFDEMLDYISKNNKDYLINVIITDAQFGIEKSMVEKFIKDINGMILFITNIDSQKMKEISKEYSTKVYYILANSNFTLDK